MSFGLPSCSIMFYLLRQMTVDILIVVGITYWPLQGLENKTSKNQNISDPAYANLSFSLDLEINATGFNYQNEDEKVTLSFPSALQKGKGDLTLAHAGSA